MPAVWVGLGSAGAPLPQTLDVIGNYFDSEVETQSTRLLSVLEPVITIVLAVIVVVLLLAVYPADVQYVRQHLICYHFRATTPRGTI